MKWNIYVLRNNHDSVLSFYLIGIFCFYKYTFTILSRVQVHIE